MSLINKIKEDENCIVILALIVGFLAGLAAGLLLAPAKNGIAFFSNNRADHAGNYINRFDGEDEECSCQ